MDNWKESYFADYEVFSEDEIDEITPKGISLRNGMFIEFSVCAENFKNMNPQSGGKCIGEREITERSFTFYAAPKPIKIKFLPRNKLIEFFSANGMVKRFRSLQRRINEFGYSTYDIT